MSSRTSSTNGHDNQGGGEDGSGSRSRQALINHAIKASRTTLSDRMAMRDALRGLDRIRQRYEQQSDDPATPPQPFIDALRRPARSRRCTIIVYIDGNRVPIVLNPQGKADPEREAWLWEYVRTLVREGATG